MKKFLAAVVFLFVLGVTPVLAHDHKMMMQSPGCSGYSFGQTGYARFTPTQIAAQGGVTATLTAQVTNVSGGILSHKVTVTPGTVISMTGASNHGTSASATLRFYANGSSTPYYTTSGVLNGHEWTWNMVNSNIGNNYQIVFSVADLSGNTTQDKISVTVVSGPTNTIVYQDGVDTNSYLQVNPNFGGGAMTQTCQICIQDPSACSGAQHTPNMTVTLTNRTSGEVQSFQGQAGSVVDENSPISGSAPLLISFVPGDWLSGSSTGEIDCSAVAGPIYNGSGNFFIETAILRLSWNPSTHATSPYCTPRSSPPDYHGPFYVPTSWRDPITGQGPAGFMDWEAIGLNDNGSFLFPQSITGASGRNVSGTYPPVRPDCTNNAAGIFPPTFPF